MRPGRPLRFLATLLGAWICARGLSFAVPVWLGEDDPEASHSSVANVPVEAISGGAGAPIFETAEAEYAVAVARHGRSGERSPPADRFVQSAIPVASALAPQSVRQNDAPSDARTAESRGTVAPSAQPEPRPSQTNRWSGQAWVLWRPDAQDGRPLAPLLGGSQIGARVDYRLEEGEAGSLSLYVRASRALDRPSAEEVAAGLSLRPGSLPFSVQAERREKLGPGGRSGFAAMVAGGLNPVEVAPRVEAEAYVQAGIVALPGRDGFVDGKASLAYRLTPNVSRPSVMIGGAVSASAQPGARRIDVGPEIRIYAPIGSGGVRLSAEWRARIAGNARPESGPAVTLMTDF